MRVILFAVLALVIAGCKTTGDALRVVEVHQPMSIRPAPPASAVPAAPNGAIFQPNHVAYVITMRSGA